MHIVVNDLIENSLDNRRLWLLIICIKKIKIIHRASPKFPKKKLSS